MKPLLYNYYIDYTKKDKTRLIILCLLHELRVISVQQLIDFFQIERLSAESTVYKHLNLLKTDGLIARSKNGMHTFYYLTKEGHNYIGGYYTLPKVPEYNLQHHLQINDYLIKMLELCNNHPHLKAVVSERRKVYEVKDEKKKRRYSQGVFPKYIKHLKNYEDARLIYVTPSSIIKEELDMFKEYFIDKEGDEYKEVFDRLHVFSAEEFESELKRLLEKDKFINWE